MTSVAPDGGYIQKNQPVTYDMGYNQPPGGQPYYPQPGYAGYGYPGPQFANYPPSQEQQQQVVVVNYGQPTFVRPPPVSLGGAIVLSCLVFWFCGWVLGGIAFILAMVGQSSAAAGDTLGAIRLRNASYGLSIAGIVVAVVIIAVVAGILGSAVNKVVTPSRCYDIYIGYYDC